MPLRSDAEYRKHLEHVLEETSRKANFEGWFVFIVTVVFLASALLIGIVYAWPPHVHISIVVAIGAMGIISAILFLSHGAAMNAAAQVTSTEWIGRKQLGEYDPPLT
jgi:hypothetical protein